MAAGLRTLNFLTESLEILTLQSKIRNDWEKIDHYNEYGSIMADKVVLHRNVSDLSLGEIVTACFTLPPFITKGRKKLELMPDGPEKIKLETDLLVKESELAAIKNLRSRKDKISI